MRHYGLTILFYFLTGISCSIKGSYVQGVDNNYYPSSIISSVSDYTAFGYGFTLGFNIIESLIIWKWPCGLVHNDNSTYGNHDPLYQKGYDNNAMANSAFFLGVKLTSLLLCEYWYCKNCSPRSMESLCIRGVGDLWAFYDVFRSLVTIYSYAKFKKKG